VKAAQYFAVCADVAIDASNKEQLPQYVDTQSQARKSLCCVTQIHQASQNPSNL
jgi:hypothetical protein